MWVLCLIGKHNPWTMSQRELEPSWTLREMECVHLSLHHPFMFDIIISTPPLNVASLSQGSCPFQPMILFCHYRPIGSFMTLIRFFTSVILLKHICISWPLLFPEFWGYGMSPTLCILESALLSHCLTACHHTRDWKVLRIIAQEPAAWFDILWYVKCWPMGLWAIFFTRRHKHPGRSDFLPPFFGN